MKRDEDGRGPYADENQKLNPSENHSDARKVESEMDQEDGSGGMKREYLGLLVILLIALGNQWQRFLIAYANGIGVKKDDPKVEIATEYKDYWKDYFGILSGLAFSFSFAVFGIFGGVTADKYNRKAIIIGCSICWSVCTLLSGIVTNFWVFFVLRVLLGFFEAFMNPAAYSVIADYFPPEVRTRANSLYNVAIYLGGACASLSQIVIKSQGWRSCYILVAIIGLACSVLGIFTIKNPTRGRWDKNKPAFAPAQANPEASKQRTTLEKFGASLKEIFQNPTCRWVAIGGFFRFFGGFSIGFFLPKYFNLMWPSDELNTAYAISNASVVSIFGFASALIGGYVGDIYETKGVLMTKAYICIFSGIFGSIFFSLCTLIQIEGAGGFAFSIIMLAMEYLCAENWIAPAITMLINTISTENKAFAVSAYLFFCTLGGTIATAIAQPLFNHFDVNDHPERTGYILTVLVLFSYLGSIPWFYAAGKSYTAFKKEEQQKKMEAGF